jgi:RND family efflux transporter MFP subunit
MIPTSLMKFGPRGLAALLSLAMVGCGKKETVPPPDPIRPVKIVELGGGEMERVIELPGQIQAFREANMGFEVPGLLQEVFVDEGDKVKKGDLLARLDDRDYRASRDSAQAQLTAARSEADRAQALFDRQATSKQRLDVALAQLQVAVSAFDRADKALQDTELRAPMDGSVAKVFVEDIVSVQAKQQIMIVHDLSRFKVLIDVPETLAILADPTIPSEVQNERFKSQVFLTTGSTEGFPAEVIEAAKTANPTTRTFSVSLAFDPPKNLNVLPGMTARLRADATALVNPESSRFNVPSYAVGGQTDGQPYLWKVAPDDMTVSKVTVQTGRVMGNEIEVMADALQLGDLIAVSGILHLREGMQVREFEL